MAKHTITFPKYAGDNNPIVVTFSGPGSADVAKSILKGLSKLSKADRPRQPYAYEQEPVLVERINLLSQKPYMEEEDTPLYMSPSSETYHSA